MNTLDTIHTRKSVRAYKEGQITDDQLSEIISAAQASPIGRAQYDSIMLTVVQDPSLIAEIEKNACESFGSDTGHPLFAAPTVIIVSSVLRKPDDNVRYSNAAIVTENMALAATDLGVGCCHIWGAIAELARSAGLVAKLGIPDGFTPCCAVTLGIPEKDYYLRPSKQRFRVDYLR